MNQTFLFWGPVIIVLSVNTHMSNDLNYKLDLVVNYFDYTGLCTVIFTEAIIYFTFSYFFMQVTIYLAQFILVLSYWLHLPSLNKE